MVKERADGAPQLNLRVPMEHHERVRRVVASLRSVEGFAARLDELLATASDPLTPSFQADIVARLERLEAEVFAQVGPVAASKARAASKPAAVNDSGDSGDRKRGNRLPDYVRDKVQELIEKHPEKSGAAIAAMVGVSKVTVNRIRSGRR
jgi:hypothetical protein